MFPVLFHYFNLSLVFLKSSQLVSQTMWFLRESSFWRQRLCSSFSQTQRENLLSFSLVKPGIYFENEIYKIIQVENKHDDCIILGFSLYFLLFYFQRMKFNLRFLIKLYTLAISIVSLIVLFISLGWIFIWINLWKNFLVNINFEENAVTQKSGRTLRECTNIERLKRIKV